MTAPTVPLNKKQQELVALHKLSPTFDLEAALEEFSSKPRGRQPKPKPAPVEVTDTEDAIRREGRFFLEHLENRNVPFVRKTCRSCDRDFLVSYKSCAYCSDSCRAVGYFETYGFIWNPDNSEANRWEFWKVPPSTIRPETLRRLEAFARSILGIEPTEEDLALPTPTIEPPVVEYGQSTNRQNVPVRKSERKTDSSTSSLRENETGIGTGPVSAAPVLDRANVSNAGTVAKNSTPVQPSAGVTTKIDEIKANFKAGLITAHELQVQLAAALRG